MKTLHKITPAIETDITLQLIGWLKDDKNNAIKMEPDFWQSFTVTAEGFEGCVIDVQVLVDEDITVYMYPCDEIQVFKQVLDMHIDGQPKLCTEWCLGMSGNNALVYDQDVAEPLFPVWLFEYYKELIKA